MIIGLRTCSNMGPKFFALRTEVIFDRLASAIIMQYRYYQYGWSSLIYAHYSHTDINNRLQEALCSL